MTNTDKQRAALEAAAHWIEEQAWSPIAENSEILRVIREALGARPTLEDFEAAARAAGWQFEPYTADIATPEYPGYWWRRDDDGPGNDEDETAKRGFACLTADSARIACQQIDGIEPDDATDAAPSAPQTPAPNWRAIAGSLVGLAAARAEEMESAVGEGGDAWSQEESDEAWAAVEAARAAFAGNPAPQTPDASALMLEALRLAEERIEMNNYGGEEDEHLAVIRAAIATGEA